MSSSYNVLSIDDNKNNLFTLNALLKTINTINNIGVLSAKEALNILLRQKIDLILCDVQMPEINGFEFAKMIKSNKKTKDIPIIFVTAIFKSEEFIKEGFSLGAVDYITKPIDDNQLLNKIRLYLKIFDEKRKTEESEKIFYDIAQSIGDGIYTLNTEQNVTFINNEALKNLGYTKGELLGKKIHNIIHYKTIDNIAIPDKDCKIHNSMLDKEIYRKNSEYLVTKNGSFLEVSIVATPLYSDNEIIGTVVVFKDKTNLNKIKNLEKEKIKNQEQIIYSMIDMIESRDSYTAGHTKRVAEYCVKIAKEMKYGEEEIALLEKAAWLHDIGKISTPDNVLLKPGKLNNMEYTLIKEHLNSGYEMLSKIDQYKTIADIMREHHEKYNGSGYPRGLKGNEINPLSRIMMVADAFDAMTTNRVYKAKKSIKIAIEELKSLSGIHFDPEVVQASEVALRDVKIDTSISQLPQTAMEEHRFSYFYKDKLTNLFIIDYLELILRYHLHQNSFYKYDIKLHNFSDYNKEFGWSKGDEFLIEFAKFIKNVDTDSIAFRVEGDDFLLLSKIKLDNIDEYINNFILFKDTIVNYSVEEEYIPDIHSKFK